MQELELNGMQLGRGRPWIIAPVTGCDRISIVNKATELARSPYVEIIEWRADCLDASVSDSCMREIAGEIKDLLGNKPLVFSLRTAIEGGKCELSDDEYARLAVSVASDGYADFVDLEVLSHTGMESCIRDIHELGGKVIGGRHYPDGTPPRTEILADFLRIQQSGADISKVVAMPVSGEDVMNLMIATNEMRVKYAERPVIGISMGKLGMISRLTCEFFGSSMTFGTVGDVSGEGQIPVEQLNAVLNIVHSTYGKE